MPEDVQEKPTPGAKTLVLLKGHHSTVVHGIGPNELQHELDDYRTLAAQQGTSRFFYLQNAGPRPEMANSVCVDPEAVVALIRVA